MGAIEAVHLPPHLCKLECVSHSPRIKATRFRHTIRRSPTKITKQLPLRFCRFLPSVRMRTRVSFTPRSGTVQIVNVMYRLVFRELKTSRKNGMPRDARVPKKNRPMRRIRRRSMHGVQTISRGFARCKCVVSPFVHVSSRFGVHGGAPFGRAPLGKMTSHLPFAIQP